MASPQESRSRRSAVAVAVGLVVSVLIATVVAGRGGRAVTVDAASVAPARPALDKGVAYDAFYLPFDVDPAKVRADLSYAKDRGATSIYLTVSERDLQDNRKITTALTSGHDLGLRVYANPYFGGAFSGDEGATASFYLGDHPGDEAVSRRGVVAGVPSINAPAFRAYLEARLDELLTYNFDGLELDEPSFPVSASSDDYFPYDTYSQSIFVQRFGHPMLDADTNEVVILRQESMHSFLQELLDHVRATHPSVTTILVVLPASEPDNPGAVDQVGTLDWTALSSISSLDLFQIDPYWFCCHSWEWFTANVHRLMDVPARPGLGLGVWTDAYGLTGTYDQISRSLQYARDSGTSAINAWLSEHLPNQDPDRAWDEIEAAFRDPSPIEGGLTATQRAVRVTRTP
jgi:hypothetical protein